tara:strand:+ start:43 stop:915 length:873 start_codon:yes stop_codon:yes gene_type:complete
MESYSQLNQDITVISFFNNKKNLFFLEIGANDGINLSNTYLLEKKYNWKGICSEPLPDRFEQLKKNRNVHCDNQAVFRESDLTVKFKVSDLTSGIIESYPNISTCNGRKIEKKQRKLLKNKENNKSKQEIDVKTITLEDLLDKYNAPNTINYFSLDTEGSELQILKSVDFTKYKFQYINVEHNYIEPRRSEIRKLLQKNGYLYMGQNQFDDNYIHENCILGTYYSQNDYSKPIEIKKLNANKFLVSSSYWEDDEGIIDNGFLTFNRLGNGKVYYSHIDFGKDDLWSRKEE